MAEKPATREAAFLVLGAVIGLLSSIATSYFQASHQTQQQVQERRFSVLREAVVARNETWRSFEQILDKMTELLEGLDTLLARIESGAIENAVAREEVKKLEVAVEATFAEWTAEARQHASRSATAETMLQIAFGKQWEPVLMQPALDSLGKRMGTLGTQMQERARVKESKEEKTRAYRSYRSQLSELIDQFRAKNAAEREKSNEQLRSLSEKLLR